MKKFLALLLAVFMLTGCSSAGESDRQIAKINDTVVTETEYGYYLNEAKANFETIAGASIWDTEGMADSAKEMALNSLLTIKISAMKADEYGFTLTDEEMAQVKTETENYVKAYGDGKTDTGFVEKMMTEKAKYNKIRESTYANYEPTDEELSEYYAEYLDVYSEMYTLYNFDTIMVEDAEKGNELIERFNNGEDFDSLSKEYEIDESVKEPYGIEIYRAELENTFSVRVDVEEGEITEVLSANGENYVMLLTKKTVPTEEETKKYIADEFAVYEQQTIFNSEYEKWKAECTVEINEEVFESISIK